VAETVESSLLGMRMTQEEDVFVSYSREDNDKVLQLTAKLRAAGVRAASSIRSPASSISSIFEATPTSI
jgi:hypothetical protein